MDAEFTVMGFDKGTGDWSTETEFRRRDDGTIEIIAIRQWRRNLDLSLTKKSGLM